MILIRDIFNLHFGKAKDAKALLKEGMEINKKYGFKAGRVLSDLTGPSYVLVLESEWQSLAEWENALKTIFGKDEWEKWYQKLVPLVNSASREIFTIAG
jgi:hypothetical protein